MDAFDAWLHELGNVIGATPLSLFLQAQHAYAFAAMETLHLLGMTLLIGTIGIFDLRVLGMAKAIRPAALHRLIPWGVAGFILNLLTGSLFVIAHPHQYFFDPAFRVKIVILLLAGLNVLAFHGTAFNELEAIPAGGAAPARSRVVTGISLAAWAAVVVCGALVSSQFFG